MKPFDDDREKYYWARA